MADMINVLQVGRRDLSEEHAISSQVKWYFVPLEEIEEAIRSGELPRRFDAVLMEKIPDEKNARSLCEMGAAYTYFYTDGALYAGQKLPDCLKRKMVRRIRSENLPGFMASLHRYFHSDRLGSKLHTSEIQLSHSYHGYVSFDGNRALLLKGDFGKEFSPLLSWRGNMYSEEQTALDLWLEYEKDPGVEIELVVRTYEQGSIGKVLRTDTFSEQDMASILRCPAEGRAISLAATLNARGMGRLSIGDLHFRRSRYGAGHFMPGGKIHADKSRREFISYFDPGDAKPPLNVYFSGYRTAEGFEGYNIMHGLGAPFLLIGDPRLEGGSFYLGSEELEKAIEKEIRSAMETLGFSKDELILSGLSMGTFGATYYGCRLLPHAIIIGKPLMNLGNVAVNETLMRPGGFPTSLDVLKAIERGIGDEEVERMNRRFWDAFEAADFSNTEFAIAYMENDDYDLTAYQDLITHISQPGVRIVGKGITGRHNDNTPLVVEWFMAQYRRILREEFHRILKR